MRIFLPNNQNGMVMVLAMFMVALLSMIGVASMMTTTTDIEIATGERQYVETFYRTQASHIIAAEWLYIGRFDRGFGDADTLDADEEPVAMKDIDDYTFAFRLIDKGIYQEPPDSTLNQNAKGVKVTVWDVNEQDVDELPCPQDMLASDCAALDAAVGNDDDIAHLWTDIRLVRMQGEKEIVLADIDIDRVRAAHVAGGGAEFGASDLGIGSSSEQLLWNVDARSRLSTGHFNKSPSRQAFGFRLML